MTSKIAAGASTVADAHVGVLLRDWRGKRGRSQLELALDVAVSQRHISFIESGRSTPSRSLLLRLARSLDIPLRERNALLATAGFASMYSEPAWDADEMRIVNEALARMLRQHEPYPAIVMDRYWNVLFSNDYAPRLFGEFIDMSARPGPRNLLRLMFDPQGMRPHIANWEELSGALMERVRRESVGSVIDDRTRSLLIDLAAYAEPRSNAAPVPAGGSGPVISICLRKDERLLRYFSMVSTVGTPQSISTQELRVESMFPADGETDRWHLKTFAAKGRKGRSRSST